MLLAAVTGAVAVGSGCRRGSPRTHGRPPADAASSVPPWLVTEPATQARALALTDRCDLLATVLTYRAPAAGGSGVVLPSLIDGESARGVLSSRGIPVAAATVRDGDDRSLFATGESCGDRLALLSTELAQAPEGPPAFAHVALTPLEADAFQFELRIVPIRSSAGSARRSSPVTGHVARRDDGEWVPSQAGRTAARAPRPLDAAPRETKLAMPLPPGRAEATFEIDTGGDIMGAPPRQAGLAVIVREGSKELRQTIASCDQASRGSALGGGGRVLDVAICGRVYRLVARPGVVVVERGSADERPVTVARFRLARPNMRASLPAPAERKPAPPDPR
jgi:hypothetical protein